MRCTYLQQDDISQTVWSAGETGFENHEQTMSDETFDKAQNNCGNKVCDHAHRNLYIQDFSWGNLASLSDVGEFGASLPKKDYIYTLCDCFR